MGLIPGNLLSYNTQSVETDVSSWYVPLGAGSLSQSTARAVEGTHSLLLTTSGTGSVQVATSGLISITGGAPYRQYYSAWTTCSRTLVVEADFYDSTQSFISRQSYPGSPTAIPASTWTQLSNLVGAPSNAAYVKFFIIVGSGVSGDTIYFDQMYFGPQTPVITITPSQQYAYNSIAISGLSGYDTLAIQRTNPDGSVVTIRSANYIAVNSDTWAGYDLEAPLGASCTYTAIAQLHNADGSVSQTSVQSSAVIIPTQNGVGWLKDLTQSALNTQVTIQAMGDVKRPGRENVYAIVGRKNAVVISDLRGGREGVVTIMTTGTADRNAVKTLLASGNVLFLQATPTDGFDDLYFAAGDVTVKRPSPDSTDPTRLWEIAFTEVDSPSGQLTSLPGNSWLLVTNFGTWQSVMNARATWLAVLNTAYGSGPGGV